MVASLLLTLSQACRAWVPLFRQARVVKSIVLSSVLGRTGREGQCPALMWEPGRGSGHGLANLANIDSTRQCFSCFTYMTH